VSTAEILVKALHKTALDISMFSSHGYFARTTARNDVKENCSLVYSIVIVCRFKSRSEVRICRRIARLNYVELN
jgi:hypothetical protein